MSRLWAFTFIAMALCIGLIVGMLVVMFAFVLRWNDKQDSALLAGFKFRQALQASSPAGTKWDVIDEGSSYRGIMDRDTRGRIYMAETKMPNVADQTNLANLLQAEFTKIANNNQGVIYLSRNLSQGGTTMASGPAGETPPAPHNLQRTHYVMPYVVGRRAGCVHLICVGDGDRMVVSIIIQEN